MSSDQQQVVHPARVDAMSKKIDALREDFEDEIAELRREKAELEKEVSELKKKMQSIGADEIDPDTPDKRALRVRKWLYEQANDDPHGKAAMDKNIAKGVLGGVNREQRYEAMRRAADGNQGAKSGSSGLSPIQGIEFQKFDDPDRLSRVVIDLEDLTNKLGRQILTTEDSQEDV